MTEVIMELLTEKEVVSLEAIKDGADVYSFGMARDLRSIQRKRPELLQIVKPQAYDGDGTDSRPYFGAIATRAGKEFLNAHKVLLLRARRTARKTRLQKE